VTDETTLTWVIQQPKFRRFARLLAELAAAADEREHTEERDATDNPCEVQLQTTQTVQKGH